MKRILLPILIIIALAVGIYFSFFYKETNQELGIWNFVGDDAIAVYHTDRAVEVWNKIYDYQLVKEFQEFEFFSEVSRQVQDLDSLAGAGKLHNLTRSNDFLISLHADGANAFNVVFYLGLNSLESRAFLEGMIDSYKIRNPEASFESRNFLGQSLGEIKWPDGEVLSFIFREKAFICSWKPFLIEDIIRHTEEQGELFYNKVKPLFSFRTIAEDEGDLYIQSGRTDRLLKGVFPNAILKNVRKMEDISSSIVLDLNIRDQQMFVNGYGTKGKLDFSDVENFSGSLSDANQYLLKRTYFLNEISFDDLKSTYWFSEAKDSIWDTFESTYNLNPAELLTYLSPELKVVDLESYRVGQEEKVLLVKSKDTGEVTSLLGRLAERANFLAGDSIFEEYYSGLPIKELPIADFPELLFGKAASGFSTTFYAQLDDQILMGNSMQTLKNYFDDLKREQTWDKSVKHLGFLENTLDAANYTAILDVNTAWEFLLTKTKSLWRDDFIKYESSIRKFELAGFQLAADGNQFLASGVLNFRPKEFGNVQFQAGYQKRLSSPIITKPTLARNHSDNSFNVLLQDSAFVLHRYNSQGKQLWAVPLNEKVEGGFESIDYFKNRKLQSIFITSTKLHMIDRLGNAVDGFPIDLKEGYLAKHLRLIDYNGSGDYRFMLSNAKGEILLLNKEGNALDGWSPNLFGGKISNLVGHQRVRGKDFMIGIREDGVIQVKNRRGFSKKGFPIETKKTLDGPLFLQTGATLAKSTYSCLSTDGELITFNLEGKITNTKTFFKPKPSSHFTLVEDVLGKDYVISRQDGDVLTLLDKEGELLFEKELLSEGRFIIQYYNFGSGNKCYVVLDQEQDFGYFYDAAGKLLGERPLEMSHPVSLLFSESKGELTIYNVFENQLRTTKIGL